MALANASTRKLSKVHHIGSFEARDKGSTSQEGSGLSVSLHPHEWEDIARLGGGTWFTLTRQGGEFLDFHRLGKKRTAELEAWGLANGWLEPKTLWRMDYWDSEDECVRYSLFETEQAARSELRFILCGQAEDADNKVTEIATVDLTSAADQRIGFKLGSHFAHDMAATFWVEDCTELDGVWWNDTLDVGSLSAPRGVILKSRLARWTVQRFEGK